MWQLAHDVQFFLCLKLLDTLQGGIDILADVCIELIRCKNMNIMLPQHQKHHLFNLTHDTVAYIPGSYCKSTPEAIGTIKQ